MRTRFDATKRKYSRVHSYLIYGPPLSIPKNQPERCWCNRWHAAQLYNLILSHYFCTKLHNTEKNNCPLLTKIAYLVFLLKIVLSIRSDTTALSKGANDLFIKHCESSHVRVAIVKAMCPVVYLLRSDNQCPSLVLVHCMVLPHNFIEWLDIDSLDTTTIWMQCMCHK